MQLKQTCKEILRGLGSCTPLYLNFYDCVQSMKKYWLTRVTQHLWLMLGPTSVIPIYR